MWFYNDEELIDIPEGYIGFVYKITNKLNGRMYVGKKNFFFSRTKQVKKKKKRFKVESDWKTYYGSNEELNDDVVKFGPENFRRDILRLCKTKAEFGYFEAAIQFELKVLESDDFYNAWISCRIHKKHLSFLRNKVI